MAYYAVWALGFVVAVDALGFDPQAVATGLGLTGLALGFALRDVISNFVSGLFILALRPFRIGDQIIIGDTEGSVERIDVRATQILTYDGRRVLVPNGEVFTARVTNNTASPVRRADVNLFLGYDVDLDHAIEVVRVATVQTPGVLDDPPAAVALGDTGPDAVLLAVRFWTDSRRRDFVATTAAVRHASIAALKDAGISLPDPAARHVVPHPAEAWHPALVPAPQEQEVTR